jgi:hypothetical protein
LTVDAAADPVQKVIDHHAEHVVQNLVYLEIEYELHAVTPGSYLAVVAGEVLMVWEDDQIPLGDLKCADLVAQERNALFAGCGETFAWELQAGRCWVVIVLQLWGGLLDLDVVNRVEDQILELLGELEKLDRSVIVGGGFARHFG